jgi:DNA-binding NarL/FixJ family response regulator
MDESMQKAVHVAVVVDDHPMVSRGVSEFLKSHPKLAQVHSVGDAAQCMALLEQLGGACLVIADFWLPAGDALALVTQLRGAWPKTRVLVMSGDDDPAIEERVRQAGANGFVRKHASPQDFEAATTAVLSGMQWFSVARASVLPARFSGTEYTPRELGIKRTELGLTQRQAQILQGVLGGAPNKRIAQDLGLSESTVKEHVTAILHKLGVSNRVAAITKMRGRRLVLD